MIKLKTKSIYFDFLALLKPYPRPIVALFLMSILSIVIETAGLGAVYIMIGSLSTGQGSRKIPVASTLAREFMLLPPGSRVKWATILIIALIGIRSALQFGTHVLSAGLRRRVELSLRTAVFARFHSIPIDAIQRERLGALMALLGQYSSLVGQTIVNVAAVLPNATLVIAYLGLALLVDPRLTVLLFGLMSMIWLSIRWLMSDRVRQANIQTRDSMKEFLSTAQESLSAMKLIHLFDRRPWSLGRFREGHESYQRKLFRGTCLTAVSRPLYVSAAALGLGLVLVSETFILKGAIETWIAQFTVLLVIFLRLVVPLSTLNQAMNQISQNHPYAEALLRYIQPEAAPLSPNGSVRFQGLRHGITIDDVGFRYAPDGRLVLSGVSLEIPKGRLIAIVGPSGGGKSTLVHLITRLAECTTGRILVDGVDLRELEIGGWRRRLAIVPQDPYIFHDTVRANLLFAKPEADDAEICGALRLAQAEEFVNRLPEGLDTVLRERGIRLSGGERQRIALARALLVDADLLILDEATSELDPETEQAWWRGLKEGSSGRATLVITHRLAILRRVDRICVLSEGRVIEQGSHDALIAGNGLYRRLYQSQALTE
jgi:ABC-type multidrug transport system fused ATPase/permease subunit